MTKASCWKHPAQYQVGVCASCLRERLAQLCVEEHYSSPQRCSFDSNSSSSVLAGAVAAEDNANNAANPVTISTLIEADQVESEYRHGLPSMVAEEPAPLPKFASFLQRTHSWSSSRQHQNQEKRNGFMESRSKDLGKTRTLARIISGKDLYGNLSLPSSGTLMNDEGCKFDFCDTPKRHYKASSWPEIESQKEQPQQQRSRGSWIASLFGLRSGKPSTTSSKESKETKQLKEKKRFFGLGRRKKGPGASATSDPVEDISCSPWRSEKLVSGDFPQSGEQPQASTPSSFVQTNRVMPLSGNGDYNLYNSSSTSKLTRVTSVNGRATQQSSGKDSFSKAWSTPLRRFMPGKESESARKSSSKGGDVDIDGFGHEDDFKSSWSISSPAELKRFHPSPAFPANSSYTAYYRDYGASWSLHSSPMPGSKGRSWNHNQQRGGRPWESREGFHAHPSPFHAAGSNTWNFYLTPLRPVRSSTSRHRT